MWRGLTGTVGAALAAWLAFMTGLVAGGDVDDVASGAVGAVIGAALVAIGFAAASRTRVLSDAAGSNRARLVALSLAFGVALGVANLGANWLIASAHPALRELLVRRFATLPPLLGVVSAPLTEEVSIRLFLMSAVAWIVSRVTGNRSAISTIALVASSVVFAALHLGRPFPGDPSVANFYRASLMTKYTLAGLPMGWLFWRWGLPYAILCHAMVNATHILLERFVF
jgi:hypothetical protein